MSPIQYVFDHPVVSLLVCLAHNALAFFSARANAGLYEMHLPPIIMELFQLMAWTVTILIGIFTLYSQGVKFVKKLRKK